jgi:hypothetical protein
VAFSKNHGLEQFSLSYRVSNGSLNQAAASFVVMAGSICATQ